MSVDETHTPALYAGFIRVLLRSKQSKSNEGDTQITLDPSLASKLLESQQNGRVADAFSAAPAVQDPLAGITQASFAQQMEPSASVYQNSFPQDAQSGYHSADGNLQQWNLDQLGQSGFWENLSMRELAVAAQHGQRLT